jgi:HK97 family phage major capsid protein
MIKQTSVKGNLKIGFELSATDAEIHEEGSDAPNPEKLKLGLVTLVPKTIKKWIYVSDEVLDMDSEDFLEYVYNELTHKIIKKAIDIVIAKILASPATATATAASVPVVAPDGISTVDMAEAELSDEVNEDNVVLIMHKKTRAYLKKLAKLAGYNVDPFNGYKVFTNNTLDIMTGTSGETGNFMIVGDLSEGVQINTPKGKNPTFKFDDLTYAEKDMVKVIGRMPAGIGVVACDRLCVVSAS